MITKTNTANRGVALLISVLVASVALAVGMGVYNRTYKELLFASFWRQAQVAFSAADTGLECAMYWDLHPAANYTCFGNIAASWPIVVVGTPQTISMDVYGGCVRVEIAKNAAYPFTTINARGYNVSCSAVTSGTNPRIVERGLRVDY